MIHQISLSNSRHFLLKNTQHGLSLPFTTTSTYPPSPILPTPSLLLLFLLNCFNFSMGVSGSCIGSLLLFPCSKSILIDALCFRRESISYISYYMRFYSYFCLDLQAASSVCSLDLLEEEVLDFFLSFGCYFNCNSYFSRFSMIKSFIFMFSMLRQTSVFYYFSHYFSFPIYLFAKFSSSYFILVSLSNFLPTSDSQSWFRSLSASMAFIKQSSCSFRSVICCCRLLIDLSLSDSSCSILTILLQYQFLSCLYRWHIEHEPTMLSWVPLF